MNIERRWNDTDIEERRIRAKTCPGAILFITNTM